MWHLHEIYSSPVAESHHDDDIKDDEGELKVSQDAILRDEDFISDWSLSPLLMVNSELYYKA